MYLRMRLNRGALRHRPTLTSARQRREVQGQRVTPTVVAVLSFAHPRATGAAEKRVGSSTLGPHARLRVID